MTGWAAETLVAGTALMLLVLALRRPVAHLFGAGWAYALWLLPALRFVLPPLPWPGAEVPITAIAIPMAGEGAAASSSLAPAIAWEPILLSLWLGGAALFLLHQAISYGRLMRRLGIGSTVRASLGHDVGIIHSRHVDGPIAVGLLDKWIVVPADFATRYTAEEQAFALAHERIHHRREDIAWNMAALVILAFNWFNPVAWPAFRAFRMDQELSCDAAVVAQARGGDRHLYAQALVKSASAPGLIAACPLNHASLLKRRLKMMKHHRHSRSRTLGGAAVLSALLLAGLGSTASIAQEQAEPKTKIRKIIINREDAAKAGLSGTENVLIEGRSLAELEDKCQNVRSESDVTTEEGGDKKRTRIVICGKDGNNPGKSAEQVVASLEKVKVELTDDKVISNEHRAKVIAALEKEIARLQAAK